MNLQTLLELTKILYEHSESEVRVERKLLNYSDNKDTKTGSYVVQLGSSNLSIFKTNNFPCSEGEGQEIINQLNELEEQKKLYDQILDKKEALASSEIKILVRGGDLGKSGPGPRAKADAMRNAQSSGSFLIPGADEFMSSGNFRSYQNRLSARRPAKIRKGQFNPDQDQGKSTCKSEIQETNTYNIKSQIGNHKKLTKISNKIRKNPKLVQEFNGLEQKLRNGNMKADRGVKPLSGSNGIYYARGYTEGARLYFKYSEDNIIVLGESNKPTQDAVIEFLLKNY